MSEKFNEPVSLLKIPLTILVIIGRKIRTQANLIKLTFDPWGYLITIMVYIHSHTQNIINIYQPNQNNMYLTIK